MGYGSLQSSKSPSTSSPLCEGSKKCHCSEAHLCHLHTTEIIFLTSIAGFMEGRKERSGGGGEEGKEGRRKGRMEERIGEAERTKCGDQTVLRREQVNK